jgi:phage tail-like protein
MPDFIRSFLFEVAFSGPVSIRDTAFQEVAGLESAMDTETVTEGGVNDFVHRLPKQVKQGTLKLKRAIVRSDSGLVDWCKEVLEGGLAKPIKPMQITINLLDVEGTPIREWTVTNAYPVKWSVGAFDAQKSELAIETIELAYNTMKRTHDGGGNWDAGLEGDVWGGA